MNSRERGNFSFNEGGQEKKVKLKDVLEEINPLEYDGMDKDNFKKYLETSEDLPEEFWGMIEGLRKEEKDLMTVLIRMRELLFVLYGDERNNANSFADSRFTSIDEIIERKLVACGSFVKVFGTALRKLEIPVKFIHGILEEQEEKILEDPEHRHSWLEIYDLQNKKWRAVDFTEESLELSPTAKKRKEYINWDELKDDYNKGDF